MGVYSSRAIIQSTSTYLIILDFSHPFAIARINESVHTSI